jgi:hypothetical protein
LADGVHGRGGVEIGAMAEWRHPQCGINDQEVRMAKWACGEADGVRHA